ncbi:unnamed protein product [Brachionus calyciflorus]|uniref:Uncharacterized protein n=1 Tax=Brachionus calyciflorus TaxID=104777 RepID=A0A813XS21_9BILA|nr:unnamed protein product [Brachionus calyciflorus]
MEPYNFIQKDFTLNNEGELECNEIFSLSGIPNVFDIQGEIKKTDSLVSTIEQNDYVRKRSINNFDEDLELNGLEILDFCNSPNNHLVGPQLNFGYEITGNSKQIQEFGTYSQKIKKINLKFLFFLMESNFDLGARHELYNKLYINKQKPFTPLNNEISLESYEAVCLSNFDFLGDMEKNDSSFRITAQNEFVGLYPISNFDASVEPNGLQNLNYYDWPTNFVITSQSNFGSEVAGDSYIIQEFETNNQIPLESNKIADLSDNSLDFDILKEVETIDLSLETTGQIEFVEQFPTDFVVSSQSNFGSKVSGDSNLIQEFENIDFDLNPRDIQTPEPSKDLNNQSLIANIPTSDILNFRPTGGIKKRQKTKKIKRLK